MHLTWKYVVVALIVCFVAAPAHAHLGSVSDVVVRVEGERVEAEVTIEAVDAADELGLASDASDEALRLRMRAIEAWLSEGLAFRRDAPCTSQLEDLTLVNGERRVLQFRILAECAGEGALVFRDETVFDTDPQHETYVRDEAGETLAILRRGRREASVERPMSTLAFFELGALHFATGLDHVLFLLGLIFAVRIRRRDATYAALFSPMAATATAFTVGHSVTLACAALGLGSPPSAWVELFIAVSVAVVAVDNLRPAPNPSLRRIGAYAMLFGLIHGFGFSTLLLERSMGSSARVWALALFNLGIEFAQILAVLFIVGFLVKLSPRGLTIANRVASALMVAVALVWVVQRSAAL